MHIYSGDIKAGGWLKGALMAGVVFPMTCTTALAVDWTTVVNNGDAAPVSKATTSVPYFFSYNQPAVNEAGQVVFRARAKPKTGEGATGGGGEPVRGVYTRALAPLGTIEIVADNLVAPVPAPNTTSATFIEFPSTPRADALSAMVASRGQSKPVVTNFDGTKVGTSGVYVQSGELQTGASQVAGVQLTPGVYPYFYFGVPGEAIGTKFDQFPGSPSPVASKIVAFKGNYTINAVGKTGVFYRNLSKTDNPVQKVVKAGDKIPGFGQYNFGSAAPPSAAVAPNRKSKIVFAGFDNEDAPKAGGIYVSDLVNPGKPPSPITPVISILKDTPITDLSGAGMTTIKLNTIGEGLSFNGKWVSFWGGWGDAVNEIKKYCPTDGNKDLIAYCNQDPKQSGQDEGGTYFLLKVPQNQGIFLADVETSQVWLVEKTLGAQGFTDFIYWTYSGKPPGGEEAEDAEPPRWRASAFTAVTSVLNQTMAFKGQKGSVDGLYAKRGTDPLRTVLKTGDAGQSVDPTAPTDPTLAVTSIGVERDGFRGSWLTATVGMANADASVSWAGIYAHNCGASCTTW